MPYNQGEGGSRRQFMDQLDKLPEQLAARYRVKKVLGEGGFARVFLARDTRLDRDIALKLYRPNAPHDAPSLIREARLLANIRHPNIITVFDADVIPEGRLPYIVMEYLAGGSLREKIGPGSRPLRHEDALGLAAVLAEALEAAHEQQILHLDIKPENILFDQRGRPFLADFGIGRAMGMDGFTRQTQAMGSGQYASPEQRQGGTLGFASDIYSLGVVLFELLTQQIPLGPAAVHPRPPYSPPFPMNHPLVAAGELVRLVCKALAVAPEFRFETAAEFASEMRDYILRAGGSTGDLLGQVRRRPFVGSTLTRVQIREPERPLRSSETRVAPRTVREMENDLPAVTPHSRVGNLLYSHQALEVGTGSVIEQPVFARGIIRLRQDTVIRGDVISLSMIDASQGVQARSLMAPQILLRGPIRLEGSILCRRLRPAESGVHLPANSEIGGSLIFDSRFEKVVGDDEIGRPLAAPRPTMEIFGERPGLRVGSHSTLVAILGDVNVEIDPRQNQLNTIRVTGDVRVGTSNQIRRIEGENVYIGAGCTVDEVHARGKLYIERGSEIGYARAGLGIHLGNHVVLSSPVIFSDNGAIQEEGEAVWKSGRGRMPLTAYHLFDDVGSGGAGSIATSLLDHRLRELYGQIAPDWLPGLTPIKIEGSASQVRRAARAKGLADEPEEEEPFQQIQLDLTPASARPTDEKGEDDLVVDEDDGFDDGFDEGFESAADEGAPERPAVDARTRRLDEPPPPSAPPPLSSGEGPEAPPAGRPRRAPSDGRERPPRLTRRPGRRPPKGSPDG